jgi:hypothetical protein
MNTSNTSIQEMKKIQRQNNSPVCIPTKTPQFKNDAPSTMPVTKLHASNP